MQPASAFRQRNICRGVFDADEAFEDAAEILPMLRGQDGWHVFENSPSRIVSIGIFPHFSDNAHGFEEETGTAAVQTGALASDAEILANRGYRT